MFNAGTNFRRKVRVDFRDHRRRFTEVGMSGLGQEDTGIRELEYSGPLAVATPVVQPSFLQSLIGLTGQYFQLKQAKTVATRQGQVAAIMSRPVVTTPMGVAVGGIPWSTILTGGALIIGGYFLVTSLTEGKGQRV